MKLVTIKESAELVGVSTRCFLNYVDQKIIKPHFRVEDRGNTTRNMWLYSDVVQGKKELARYKNSQKEMTFKRAEWSRKHKELKAEALQSVFNVWLFSHCKVTPPAEVMI